MFKPFLFLSYSTCLTQFLWKQCCQAIYIDLSFTIILLILSSHIMPYCKPCNITELVGLPGNLFHLYLPACTTWWLLYLIVFSICYYSIGSLKSLERLDVGHNGNLKTLPDRVSELDSLKVLDVRYCDLSTLPHWWVRRSIKRFTFSRGQQLPITYFHYNIFFVICTILTMPR